MIRFQIATNIYNIHLDGSTILSLYDFDITQQLCFFFHVFDVIKLLGMMPTES